MGLALAALAVAALVGCGQRLVSVEGRITHSTTGEPLRHALVRDAVQDSVVEADSSGHYALTGISRRPHSIYFGAEGFETLKVRFRARGRDTLCTLNVKLDPAPFEVSY